jgi:hydroxyacylglutathione hydrolase
VLRIETIETAWLGNRSYVVIDESEPGHCTAIVIDPPRDIDRVLQVVEAASARITLVAETHWHADYLSGGLQLSRECHAAYAVPPTDPLPGFEAERVIDGTSFDIGALSLRAIHTPGHTAHHMSYVLSLLDQPAAVFTGGSLLHGAVGRTDLGDPSLTRALSELQWRSAHRLASVLPEQTVVLPTHGFGSFCSAAPASRRGSSTIGKELRCNSALLSPRDQFVSTLLAGYDAFPTYYRRTPTMNAAGPEPIDLTLPPTLDAAEVLARIEAGEWVVDLRQRRTFADSHVPGTINFDAGGNVGVYLPWLLPNGASVTLLAEDEEQVERVRRHLAVVGVDDIAGYAVGRPNAFTDSTASYPVLPFARLAEDRDNRACRVLDVRNANERADGHIAGSLHIPLPELLTRFGELPPPGSEELWVHCQTGFRAAVAASILEQAGHGVVLIDEPFSAATEAGLPIATGHSQTGPWVPGSSGMRTPTSRAVSSATS